MDKKALGGQLIEVYSRHFEGGDFVLPGETGKGNEYSSEQGMGIIKKEMRERRR